MDKQGKHMKSGTPLFDGLNYAFWTIRMELFLQAQGAEIWKAVLSKYNVPVNPPTKAQGKKAYEDNSKAMNAILSGLTETVFVKVMLTGGKIPRNKGRHCPFRKSQLDS